MPTPLYDCLKAYADRTPLRLHMPGHKGKSLPGPAFDWTALDVTELPPTGNLYQAGEPFDAAQALWARVFGAEYCQLLTGGSTQAVHAGLALCCSPGGGLLLDRCCHRSAFHACALLDLSPVYLERPWLPEEGISGPISPEQVERAMEQHPDIKTVCITSPSYYGLLSDVAGIAEVVHSRAGLLFVDGAHGAHLPFLGLAPFAGADAVAVSAHKTLPALGQGGLLLTRGFDPGLVRRRSAVFGTSSPSYPILASMDLARDYLEGPGGAAYRRAAAGAAALRARFPSLGQGLPLDPCRLTVLARDGRALARRLEEAGIFPELADSGHVVFILTCADAAGDLRRLAEALEENRDLLGPPERSLPSPPLPERALSLREALFAPREALLLEDCLGRVAAEAVALYPPGAPVAAPGERLGKKELAYLREIGYNKKIVDVVKK